MASGREQPLVYLLRDPEDPDLYEEALRQRGFRARSFPVLAFRFVNQPDLVRKLGHAEQYAGLIVTSPRGAEALANGLDRARGAAWRERPVYVVGPATAERVQALGLHAIGQDAGDAQHLADRIVSGEVRQPLLFLCGDRSRAVIPERLHAAGVPFEALCVYETHLRTGLDFSDAEVPEWVVFFSPSGVEAFQAARGVAWDQVKRAAIGRTTADALAAAALAPDAVAAEPSPEGLADALTAGSGR